MRSMCVGVAETGGIDTYAERVCRRRRDRGIIDRFCEALLDSRDDLKSSIA